MQKPTELVKTAQKGYTSTKRGLERNGSNVGFFMKKLNRVRKCLPSLVELRSGELLMNYAVMRPLLGNANVPLSIESLLPLGC